jgi:hypothetical protein
MKVWRLQSALRRALNVLTYQHENVEMPSHFNVKSIVAYVKVGESLIF